MNAELIKALRRENANRDGLSHFGGRRTMSRYIDADALKAKKTYSHERHEYVVPVAEIDWMPTVDAVPVVRCKDCKHYEVCKNGVNGWCNEHERPTDVTYFCADGERRSDGK